VQWPGGGPSALQRCDGGWAGEWGGRGATANARVAFVWRIALSRACESDAHKLSDCHAAKPEHV